MAVNRAPAAASSNSADGEVSEREYQATLNRAVEDTEAEIFADALGQDELDNDADTSLEDMGEGLEGEVEDDAEEEAEGEGEPGEPEAGEGEEAEAAEGEPDEGEQPQEPPRDQRGQFREREPAVPPYRLREQTERATMAEERAQALERQVAEMNGRLAELSARANAPPPRQQQAEPPAPKPDMFTDPDGYERWVLEQAERRVQGTIEQRFTQFQQQQQAREAQRVDESLAMAARGERAFEFGAAYNALTSLDRNSPQARSTVSRIYNAADPAAALFDWWEANGGPEYRDQVYQQVAPRVQQRAGNGMRQPQQGQQQQPRHVIRPGQRLPSLNSATGSNSQRISDPEMLDGSDEAIFRFGTRR
jgi:hypothetical protein